MDVLAAATAMDADQTPRRTHRRPTLPRSHDRSHNGGSAKQSGPAPAAAEGKGEGCKEGIPRLGEVRATHKKGFHMVHCWDVLKNANKWMTSYAAYNEAVRNGTAINLDGEDDDQGRPALSPRPAATRLPRPIYGGAQALAFTMSMEKMMTDNRAALAARDEKRRLEKRPQCHLPQPRQRGNRSETVGRRGGDAWTDSAGVGVDNRARAGARQRQQGEKACRLDWPAIRKAEAPPRQKPNYTELQLSSWGMLPPLSWPQ
ncbi:hypothetical protein QYE76_005899 [Lolium multiflorum]|uniref:No apical meristem-associated C-terminal domain-containing protein n=1 Tax=Lolium multiflorum TaxID=4521 RepID=A0AAD8RUY4_LOLMU|nr:hypothetical protein QYE76_005899 [Lolium multiflorum]